MFASCSKLTSFNSDLPNLTNGERMFYYCGNLKSFSSDLSSLTNGNSMFYTCTALNSFSSDLSSLTNGEKMFYNSKLTTFSSDSSGSPVNLSSLTNGNSMFFNTALESFSSDLSSLTSGNGMFSSCYNLKSFNSNLSSLTDGRSMFSWCSNLTSFNSNLSKLTNGTYMFNSCKLDTPSVQNIADTINTVTGNPSITIGVETEDDKQIYFEQMRQKGWDVLVTVNGGSCNCCASCCATCCASLTTLDETDGEFVAPKPYWAKPVPSDEEHAQYTDSEGNFFNILGGDYIYVHDPETYGMFTSLEDAAAQMRLKKIGEVEIETA